MDSEIQKYLVEVAAGTIPINHRIVYHLQDSLNFLPDLTDLSTMQRFASSTNDQMLVVYFKQLATGVDRASSFGGLQDNDWES